MHIGFDEAAISSPIDSDIRATDAICLGGDSMVVVFVDIGSVPGVIFGNVHRGLSTSRGRGQSRRSLGTLGWLRSKFGVGNGDGGFRHLLGCLVDFVLVVVDFIVVIDG